MIYNKQKKTNIKKIINTNFIFIKIYTFTIIVIVMPVMLKQRVLQKIVYTLLIIRF